MPKSSSSPNSTSSSLSSHPTSSTTKAGTALAKPIIRIKLSAPKKPSEDPSPTSSTEPKKTRKYNKQIPRNPWEFSSKRSRSWQKKTIGFRTLSGSIIAFPMWKPRGNTRLQQNFSSRSSRSSINDNSVKEVVPSTNNSSITDDISTVEKEPSKVVSLPPIESLKPILCIHPGCGKRFTEESSMRKHYALGHGKRQLKCKSCNVKFPDRLSLSRHQRAEHPTMGRRRADV